MLMVALGYMQGLIYCDKEAERSQVSVQTSFANHEKWSQFLVRSRGKRPPALRGNGEGSPGSNLSASPNCVLFSVPGFL